MPQSCRVAAALLILLSCIGCEDAGPALSGSVSYNGAPVADGYITFTPVESGTSFAAKISNGQYEPEKVYAGQYRVLVTATTADLPKPKTREEAAKMTAADRAKAAASVIPENAEGNNQTVEITAGQQTLDFTLTGPQK